MNGTTRKREPQWPVSVGVYGVLFLFGAVQGLIGSFQYSRAAGSVLLVSPNMRSNVTRGLMSIGSGLVSSRQETALKKTQG